MKFEHNNPYNLRFYSCCELISGYLKGGFSEIFPACGIFIYYSIKSIFVKVICISNVSENNDHSKCCVAVISFPWFWFDKSNCAVDLEILIVHPSYRNLGYGSELINYIVKFLKYSAPNCTSLKLRTNKSLKNKAIKFYKRNGFKVLINKTKNNSKHKLLMTKTLL